MSLDQIWVVTPDPHFLGYFYIENVVHTGARICMLGPKEQDLGLAVGDGKENFASQQLWKLNSKGNGYFEIINKEFALFLTIWDNGSSFGARPADGTDAQQWKLDVRYDCKIEEREIFRYDNTGNDNMAYQRFEVTIGVVMLYPDYIMKTSHSSEAAENAMATNMLKKDITYYTFTELKTQQWRTYSMEKYEEWYEVHMVPLNAYPNRKYRITQFVAVCTGKLETDKLEVLGPWKAYTDF